MGLDTKGKPQQGDSSDADWREPVRQSGSNGAAGALTSSGDDSSNAQQPDEVPKCPGAHGEGCGKRLKKNKKTGRFFEKCFEHGAPAAVVAAAQVTACTDG